MFLERPILRKILFVISFASYALTVLLLGGIARAQFRDRRLLAAGKIVQATVIDASNGKSSATGTVSYLLPSGTQCRDWIELGPNDSVHPGDELPVAVDETCGHPASTKKRVNPWLYLTLCLGVLVIVPFQIWRSRRKQQAISNAI